jgi:sensor histidine kinase YesM
MKALFITLWLLMLMSSILLVSTASFAIKLSESITRPEFKVVETYEQISLAQAFEQLVEVQESASVELNHNKLFSMARALSVCQVIFNIFLG